METSLVYKRGTNFNPIEVQYSELSIKLHLKLSNQTASGLAGLLQCTPA